MHRIFANNLNDMREEIWKDIPNYEGYYQVSNLGRVRSLDRFVNSPNGGRISFGKILKNGLNVRGYLLVTLNKLGIGKSKSVHQLVGISFIPNPLNLPQINHKDEVKINNRVENLEWCDSKYNINYGGCVYRSSKSRRKPVSQLTLDGVLVKEWDSATSAKLDGHLDSMVASCCKGIRKKHHGYKWEYIQINL